MPALSPRSAAHGYPPLLAVRAQGAGISGIPGMPKMLPSRSRLGSPSCLQPLTARRDGRGSSQSPWGKGTQFPGRSSAVAVAGNGSAKPAPPLPAEPGDPSCSSRRGIHPQAGEMGGVHGSSLSQAALPALQRHFHRTGNKRIRKRCE